MLQHADDTSYMYKYCAICTSIQYYTHSLSHPPPPIHSPTHSWALALHTPIPPNIRILTLLPVSYNYISLADLLLGALGDISQSVYNILQQNSNRAAPSIETVTKNRELLYQ